MASSPVNPDDEDIRLAEAKIMERRVKERRRADRWGRYVERGMIALLCVLYIIGFSADEHRDTERVQGFGAAVLINCEKTEQVKRTIRRVLGESIESVERSSINIPGYGPKERLEAIERLRRDIARFLPDNCRELEAVRLAVGAGLDAKAVEAEVQRVQDRDVRRDRESRGTD